MFDLFGGPRLKRVRNRCYSDSDYEFEEDEDTSGVYIVEPNASLRPFVSESRKLRKVELLHSQKLL